MSAACVRVGQARTISLAISQKSSVRCTALMPAYTRDTTRLQLGKICIVVNVCTEVRGNKQRVPPTGLLSIHVENHLIYCLFWAVRSLVLRDSDRIRRLCPFTSTCVSHWYWRIAPFDDFLFGVASRYVRNNSMVQFTVMVRLTPRCQSTLLLASLQSESG